MFAPDEDCLSEHQTVTLNTLKNREYDLNSAQSPVKLGQVSREPHIGLGINLSFLWSS